MAKASGWSLSLDQVETNQDQTNVNEASENQQFFLISSSLI